ncbi:hypothetical protein DICVIV_02664 [Dictyocaulus viviparus]|uniref:Uncharacterized protein n=1 Tax=Dictyocaulus viviparus TaxID=29172 RepID=A0A0D8Y9G8_DICVI|nr:hypothetical protein DICVIV_02664 [Dictyocaulus viviparus]
MSLSRRFLPELILVNPHRLYGSEPYTSVKMSKNDLKRIVIGIRPPERVIICSYYNDTDEHSLGSCSAEVAAINSYGQKEKSKKKNGIIKTTPIRPQPCRPQPIYGTSERGIGPRSFATELEVPSIPRVSSFDHVVHERRDFAHNSWRSGSQEPHPVSITSDEQPRPSPSAFQSVSNFSSSRAANIRGSLRSLPDAGLIIRSKYQPQQHNIKDPSLAIDQLCAELELNTELPLTSTDKRRSFPTSYAHENSYINGNSLYEQPRRVNDKKAQSYQHQQQPTIVHHTAVSTHQSVHQSHSTPLNNNNSSSQHRVDHIVVGPHAVQHQQLTQRSQQTLPYSTINYSSVPRKTPQRQQKSLDEVTNMLNNVANDFNSNHPQRKRSQPSHILYATPHSTNQSNPFETINKEKINPSRVEAMHSVFEQNTAPIHSKLNAQFHHIRLRDDEGYHEIGEFTNRNSKRTTPPRQCIGIRHSPQNYTTTEFIPAYPTTQPPSHPPGRNGSATSSQNGGYYSSNSSGISAPTYQNNQIAARRSSVVGHQSISSRAASVADDDDDGFYDNIGTFDDRRFSRSSEMDVTSLSSHHLPPSGWKPTKIGSLLRKFGGGGKPPTSAASLVSLNKVLNEAPIKPGNLMKSNSLSNEPWKKMVIDGSNIPPREPTPSKGGFGARIKNSIFGPKRRLNG